MFWVTVQTVRVGVMCCVSAVAAVGFFTDAMAERGPAVQLTSGEHSQAYASDTAVTRSGRQLVTWVARVADKEHFRVWGRVVDPAQHTPVGDKFAISGSDAEDTPVWAFGGEVAVPGRRNEFLVTWIEANEDGYGVRLMARRFSEDGGALSAPLVIVGGAGLSDVEGGAVAYGGPKRGFLVTAAWQDEDGYASYVARVTADASAIAESIRITPYAESFLEASEPTAVAYDSHKHRFLVATNGVVYARTVPGRPGGKLGDVHAVSPPGRGSDFRGARLAYNPVSREFAAVWTGAVDPEVPSEEEGLYVRRVGPAGRPREAPQLLAVQAPEHGGTAVGDLEAAPGGRYYVLYQDGRSALGRRLGARLKLGPERVVQAKHAVPAEPGGLGYSLLLRSFVATWAEAPAEQPDDAPCCLNHDIFTRTL